MATWGDYHEKECIPKKHVKIIIHGSAKHYEDVPENDVANSKLEGVIDFDEFVNKIFCAHKEQLNDLFNSVYGLEGNSVDKEFSFDSVEKQIR
ncbi:MAG: hypothetical protein KAH68_05420 [Draconibacterium sp.]|nr:hypothetical protein [Draconibacterium sp.]